MFGLIVSGRPPILESIAISATQLGFTISSIPAFSYLVVFVLPGQELPVDAEAQAWIQFSPAEQFTLLGSLSAEKPSAIFHLRNKTKQVADVVSIGIELKPKAVGTQSEEQSMEVEVYVSVTDVKTASSASNRTNGPRYDVEDIKSITEKVLQSQQDYFASFDNIKLPMNAVKMWKEKFFLRLEHNPAAVGFENVTTNTTPQQRADAQEQVD